MSRVERRRIMKKVVVGSIVLILLVIVLLVIKDNLRMSIDDFKVAGIGLNDSKQKIDSRLGIPINNDLSPWTYKGLDVEFWQYHKSDIRVSNISISKIGYKTKRGIGIGDSVDKVYKKYGHDSEVSDNFPFLIYSKDIFDWKYPLLHYDICFDIKDGKVAKIKYSIETD